MAKTNSITVEYNEVAQGTKNNDEFHITGATKSATIDLVNAGTDTLYFDVPIQIIDDTRANGTDLEIFYTRAYEDNPSMIYKLTIKNYFTSEAHTATKSSLKKIHFVSRVDSSLNEGSLLDYIPIKNLYTMKDNVVTGSKYNDVINFYSNDSFVINGGNGNDYIVTRNGNDTISGGKGNDTIISCGGDDVLTGGAGNNEYRFNNTFGNNTINLTKNENFNIKLLNYDASQYYRLGYSIDESGNAIISYDKTDPESNGITITNFANKNTTKNANIIIGDNDPKDLKTDIIWDKKITKSYKGSYLSENIDASEAEQQYKNNKKLVKTNLVIDAGAGNDIITGSAYNDVIKGGIGDDTINGSLDADSITGGIGKNSVVYSDVKELEGDKIYLTKGENLTIDISKITSNPDDVSFAVNGKDLVVTVNNEDTHADFTIINFGTKDVTNNATKKTANTSSVELKLSKTVTLDLRNGIIAESKTGTWHNDFINQEGYEIKKKGVLVTNPLTKGLTIKGAAGDDRIIGSNYSDTIKGGDGSDTISGGTGNDKLYGEGGSNTFVFNAGDGQDTIYSGKGEDTLEFNSIQLENITLLQGTGNNNKDLIIKYTNSDTVTIKNYYTVKKGIITGVNPTNSIKNITTTEGTFALADYTDKLKFGWGKGLNDSQHNTITMNPTSIQNSIIFNKNATIGNLKFTREDYNLRIWYNSDNTPDELKGKESSNVYTVNGTEVYKINDTYSLCSSVIIKDYFSTENQTIDKIILKYDDKWTHKNIEFSITNDSIARSNGSTGFANYSDLKYPETVELGTYENNIYTGTKYADLVYTRSNTETGDTVYTGDGNDFVYTWGNADTIYTGNGNDYVYGNKNCQLIDLGAGDDEASVRHVSGDNPQGYIKIYGGEGNDSITASSGTVHIYTNSETAGKDTTDSTDTVDISSNTGNENIIYAQSGTNIIKGGKGNDCYYAYINQKTSITENGGTEDVLNILDSPETTDGKHSGLNIVFNIEKDGESITPDSLMILDDTNFAKWQANISDESIVGINIKGNDIAAIETINSSDGYFVNTEKLNALKADVTSWLTTANGGAGYADVATALTSEDADLATLVAMFNRESNWQTT